MKGLLYILLLISMLFNTATANNLDNYITDMDCHMSMMMHEDMEMENDLSEDCCECENCNICVVNISYAINNIKNIFFKQSEKYSFQSEKNLSKKYLLYRPPKLV